MDAKVIEQVDARKERFGADEVVKLARGVSHIWIAKGKNLTHFDMKKDKPSNEQLAAAMLGPTGNLRAPTIRRGKRLFVGFNEQMYRDQVMG